MAEYNGWSNRETWAFHNWLINSIPYEHYSKYCNLSNNDIYDLSKLLKEPAEDFFYEIMKKAGVAGWMHDICSGAFCKIDFYEIAEVIVEYNQNEKEKEALNAS